MYRNARNTRVDFRGRRVRVFSQPSQTRICRVPPFQMWTFVCPRVVGRAAEARLPCHSAGRKGAVRQTALKHNRERALAAELVVGFGGCFGTYTGLRRHGDSSRLRGDFRGKSSNMNIHLLNFSIILPFFKSRYGQRDYSVELVHTITGVSAPQFALKFGWRL